MKSIILCSICFFINYCLIAQYSFNQKIGGKTTTSPSSLQNTNKKAADTANVFVKIFSEKIDKKKRKEYYSEKLKLKNTEDYIIKQKVLNDESYSIAYKTAYVDSVQVSFDSIKRSYNDICYLMGKAESYKKKNVQKFKFITYASDAEAFYEGDTILSKFFRNNKVVYSPNKREMTLSTEIVNDYLGPFRIGIGISLNTNKKDSSTTFDSSQLKINKEEIYNKLQNGGGDFNVKFQYPLIKNQRTNNLFFFRMSLYNIVGFSFTDIKKSNKDFVFSNDIGLDGVVSIPGLRNKINLFGTFKAGYIFGNKNFKKFVSESNEPESFPLIQIGAGLDISDGYRFQVDFYTGKSFIKNNLGTTITFTIRPGSM